MTVVNCHSKKQVCWQFTINSKNTIMFSIFFLPFSFVRFVYMLELSESRALNRKALYMTYTITLLPIC